MVLVVTNTMVHYQNVDRNPMRDCGWFQKVCSPETKGLDIYLINKIYNYGPSLY